MVQVHSVGRLLLGTTLAWRCVARVQMGRMTSQETHVREERDDLFKACSANG